MPASLLTVTPLTASGISTVIYNFPSQGLVGWFDASQVAGISSGASFSAWTDLSGSAHHLLQTSAVSQPIFLTNVQNGLSAVSSFGTLPGRPQSVMTANFTQNHPTSIFLVFSVDTAPTTQQDLVDGIAAGKMLLGPSAGGASSGKFEAANGVALLSGFTVSIGSWYAGGCTFNGSTSTIYISNVAVGGDVGSGGNPVGLSLFGRAAGPLSVSASAKIGEVIMYNRTLSAAEVSLLTTYLNTKWATL